MSCADIFSGSWTQHRSGGGGEDEDDDIVVGDEFVSAMDPILLSRMEHPARGIYCTHAACFDASIFYSLVARMKAWKCPHCFIQIKGIQELYIDYAMKRALMKYQDSDRLVLCGGEYFADVNISISKTSDTIANHDSSDSEDEERPSKKSRRASVITV
ncbi:MIZ-type zinc finger transcription factor [Phycomyces blakesleeanus NRRL 1555(-)]|uniref:MIZ-type zinc finger transcription factor n=2 Tax=Phycomyces blakesleeanus TaxID=4837 RepID=A0A167QRP9_PHYB8|nr:MIZ-type zinc finger transcription factor [Phycomyces blakesleeanus NRRL 1555(-)]OAD80148.1 MIZ-type zinc finger transcription factor [Phycomyces blakesleeanus NRRL 1555(-)]|eukprot:XP_018298188.1 MIZ-type zinc finger transcription factor [Phycomyces blakesleeanus NRRL 1555(-)]